MDIFDKYANVAGRHDRLLELGIDPFAVRIDEILSATLARINGRETILVGTNNYLGMTFDPACIEAGIEAMRHQGTGTTGSRIANGTYGLHKELEEEIARFLGRRKAIVFSTGYTANLGMIAGLAGPRDVILLDADSHSSIYDGCRLSGAKVIRFRHNDPDDLDKRLGRLGPEGDCKLVIVEGIYSILGDRGPLRELVEVKDRHGAFLLVDEAHSLGVFGDHGRGVAEADGVEAGCDFIAGTFSKRLGSIGGFGVSDHPRFEVLRFAARPYMFTASPGPATIATTLTALRRIQEMPELRTQIWANAGALYDGLAGQGFEICAPASPIIAVKLKDELTAVWAWNRLLELGVYVNLALPPGTPNGACLLRCSLSAAHTRAQIDEVVRRFGVLGEELAALPAALAAEVA
jgi:8-amino-7-oxononanoate synthase